jgi:hypothetical protein
MSKQMSALLLLAVLGCLLTRGNCLQLQHEQDEINALVEGGRCQYGYVLSLDGKVWEKTPSNAPDAGGFATKQRGVSFEGIDYVLYKDENG